MRNLKRALSLTLASVMLLGMMVVGSSAAAGYDDVDEKNNIEAIEVLQTIEVMVGDERGFGPDRPVNRAEMAVVMGKLLDLDYNYYATSCPFNDVYDWARGWVGACYANKIVSGRGDGVYDPGATVTAVEASSMLMRALGYFQYANDVADGFELATVRQGTKIGIYDGVGSSATEPMTRDQVAQMVLNALQSGMVEPDGNTINLTTPDGTVFTGKVNYVFRTSAKDFANAIGKVGATSIGSTNEGWIVELGEQLYNGDLKLYDDRTDDFGRPSRKWEYDGKAIGTYMKKEIIKQEYTNEVKGKDLYDLLGSDTIKTYDLEVTIDGVNVVDEKTVMDTKAGSYFDATHMAKTWKSKVGQTGKGVLTQVFVDPDWNNGKGKIWVSVINTYLAKATGDYNDKKDEIKLDVYGLAKDGSVYYKYYDKANDKLAAAHSGKDYENLPAAGEDFSKVIDMKKDDIILVTVANGDIKTVADPEVLSAVELSEFSKNKYVVSDSKYEYNTTIDYDPDVLDTYTAEGTSGTQQLKDTEYNLFLDPYGYLIGVEVVEAVKNYIFLTGIDQGNSNLNAKTSDAAGILTDGTFVNFRMNMKDSKTVTTGNNPVKTVNLAGQTDGDDPTKMTAGKFQGHALWNTWCTYTVDKDGTYTLTEVGDFASTTGAKPAKAGQYADLTTVSKEIGTKRVSLLGDTNKYVYGNDDSVYILAELKEVNSKNTIYGEFKIAGGVQVGTDKQPDTPVIVISGVDSVETGVDNVKIKTFASPADIKKAADNSTADIYPGYIYTLFDKDGYIIASVLLGEDDGTSKNLVYSHKGSVESEKYNKTDDDWTWTRYVIKDGEETLLTQTGNKADPDNSIYLMKENTWYEVTYKADGSVKSVEYAYFNEGKMNVGVTATGDAPISGNPGTVSGPALDPAYINAVTEEGDFVNHIEFLEDALNNDKTTVLYEEVWGKTAGNKVGGATYGDGGPKDAMPEKNEPSLKGSTLYVDTDASKGFYVSGDVKSVLIQKNNGEKTTTYGAGTSDLESMLRDLNFDNGTYLFKISAILVNGRATVVIIHDWNETTATPGSGNGGNGGDDEDGLGISQGSGKLIYKYHDSEFDVKDWKTIREDAANAAAAYYGVGLATNGNTITTIAPANGSKAGEKVRLDDGSLKGEEITVDIVRMVKITKDGTFVDYTPADGATATTVALGSGNYTMAATAVITDGNEKTGNQNVTAAANATDADVAWTTVYKVTLANSVTATLEDGTTNVATTNWVKKDTLLKVTGPTSAPDGLTHQLTATVGGTATNVGAAVKHAAATDKTTGDYTVSEGNVTLGETKGYTVKVPGKAAQVLAAGATITFTAPSENAVYAAKKDVTNGEHTAVLTMNGKIGTTYEYKVNASDVGTGDNAGTIELVQVAKVTLTTGANFTANDTKFAKGSETAAQLTSARYYEVGVVLTLTGAEAATAKAGEIIVVKQPASAATAVRADANGVAEAGNGPTGTKASATYTIQSTDYDLNFDKAAPTP